MPVFSHPYGEYSVLGTFNEWFSASVASALPSWMPSAVVNYDYPRTPLTFPSFSVTHMGTDERAIAQSDNLDAGWKGVRKVNIASIGCWESRDRTSDFEMHIRQMTDMVLKLVRNTPSVEIKNLYTGATSATGIGAIMRLEKATQPEPIADPNPNVEGRAVTIVMSWLERVAV